MPAVTSCPMGTPIFSLGGVNPGPWGALGGESALVATGFQNLGFEDGALGVADHWLFSSSDGARVYAAYGSIPEGFEGFEEGWSTNEAYQFQFTLPGDAVAAIYVANTIPTSFENFEKGWDNDTFIDLLVGDSPALYNSGADDHDSFETAWANDTFQASFSPGDTTGFVENFESGWNNGSFSPTLVASTAATYDNGWFLFQALEDFLPVFLDKPWTTVGATDVCDSPAHGHVNDERVTVRSSSSLPSGLNSLTTYYIVNKTTNTFKLSLTLGGSSITMADKGIGDHIVHADETINWTLPPGDV